VWEDRRQTMSGEAEFGVRPDLAADPEEVVFSRPAEFGGGQRAAGDRRHRQPRSPRLVTSQVRGVVSNRRRGPGPRRGRHPPEDLIDEYRQFRQPDHPRRHPGTSRRWAKPLDLRLTESRTFGSRVVYLRYQRHALSLAEIA